MEITLTEALRIKSELAQIIKTLNYGVMQASFGVTTEDNEVISEDKETFENVERSLVKSLEYSYELNNAIALFNKSSAVDQHVRRMQNAKLLLDVYNRSLDKTKPKKNKRFENLGTVRKSVEIVYTPSITAKEMKSKISHQKGLIRTIQSDIEKLNQTKITVGFAYSDIENLVG